MTVTAIESAGNSSKFLVVTKRGEFKLALSYTLRTRVWELPDTQVELSAATDLAEAIVSRHDPALPFKQLYIFAEHNSDPVLKNELQRIRKFGIER